MVCPRRMSTVLRFFPTSISASPRIKAVAAEPGVAVEASRVAVDDDVVSTF